MKDCADDGCTGIRIPCSGTDVCVGGVKLWNCTTGLLGLCLPYVPLPENTGLLCHNNLDEDCDGKIDCRDVAGCSGKQCGAGRLCCADGGCGC